MGADAIEGFFVQWKGLVIGAAASSVEDDVFVDAFVAVPVGAENVMTVKGGHGYSSSSKFSSMILTASSTKALKVQFFPRIAFSTSSITSTRKRIDLLDVGGISGILTGLMSSPVLYFLFLHIYFIIRKAHVYVARSPNNGLTSVRLLSLYDMTNCLTDTGHFCLFCNGKAKTFFAVC